MQPLNYITDIQGNKTAMILNLSNNSESKILNYWLKESNEKRDIVNLYVAKFLYEITSDKTEKNELKNIIKELEDNDTKENKFVIYTTKNKGLTKEEFSKILLKASDESHKGINLIEHSEVVKRINKRFEEYENNLAK